MKKIFLLILVSFMFVGCSTTQKGAALGGASGALLGGIIGHQTGNDTQGAAIGGLVGVVGGMMVGDHMDKKFCPLCGASYIEGKKFCPIDGEELKYKQK